MSKLTLDSIASAKAKLEEELSRLEAQENQLRQQEASDIHGEIKRLLTQNSQYFNPKQKSELVALLTTSDVVRKDTSSKEIAPKYWLPHTHETWTGRGRPPRSFTAWEGTAAYKEWKATHPNEKFPKYPG